METYKIDWKDVVYGTIEIVAENGLDAENKLMNMSLKELLENYYSIKSETELK